VRLAFLLLERRKSLLLHRKKAKKIGCDYGASLLFDCFEAYPFSGSRALASTPLSKRVIKKDKDACIVAF